MELVEKKVEEGWVKTQWNLRRPVGWSEICNAVSLLYNQFHQTELLTSVMLGQGEKVVTVSSAEEILKIEESSTLTIRGFSTNLKIPLMLNFVNQLNVVYAIFPEYKNLDKFMDLLTKFMNTVEMLMDKESSFTKSVSEINRIFTEVFDEGFNIGLSDDATQEEIDAERRKIYEQDGILSFPFRKDYLHRKKEIEKDYKRCKIIDSDVMGKVIALLILTLVITFEGIKLLDFIRLKRNNSMQTFSEKRKYYIRLDKNYEGKEKGTFYPKITFKKNEITGKVEPHIELCDSIYRAIKQISLDGNSDNEDAVDFTEISGLELKQMIEKMNQVYGKDFKIDCHIRRFESIFSSDF